MRRAVALVLGTITGTSLLVGAKLATPSPDASTATSDDTGATAVVVTKPTGKRSTPASSTSRPTGPATPHGTATPSPTKTTPKPTPTPTPTATGLADGTYTASAPVGGGRHGTLSMTVTISGHRISDIAARETDDSNCYRSVCPTLKSEALAAQSASIHAISHATQTSDAYMAALQAVLNSAKG